jgi:hypothetical protein
LLSERSGQYGAKTTMTDRASSDPTYVMGHSAEERERLIQQAGLLGPITERYLRTAGIVPCMRVLDVGCGVGDVTLLCADLVGRQGSVIGVDRDPAALGRPRADCIGSVATGRVAGRRLPHDDIRRSVRRHRRQNLRAPGPRPTPAQSRPGCRRVRCDPARRAASPPRKSPSWSWRRSASPRPVASPRLGRSRTPRAAQTTPPSSAAMATTPGAVPASTACMRISSTARATTMVPSRVGNGGAVEKNRYLLDAMESL